MSWSITLIVAVWGLLQWVEKRSYRLELRREVESRKRSDAEWERLMANLANAYNEYIRGLCNRQSAVLEVSPEEYSAIKGNSN